MKLSDLALRILIFQKIHSRYTGIFPGRGKIREPLTTLTLDQYEELALRTMGHIPEPID